MSFLALYSLHNTSQPRENLLIYPDAACYIAVYACVSTRSRILFILCLLVVVFYVLVKNKTLYRHTIFV